VEQAAFEATREAAQWLADSRIRYEDPRMNVGELVVRNPEMVKVRDAISRLTLADVLPKP
jgi:hypothetical protein